MSNILIVDDSPTMRRMVAASLRALPRVSFGEASSGLEAIEKLATAPVDLMILDLNMPDMHGLEVVTFMRKHATFRGVPIIVLTTRSDADSQLAAIAAGATHYLTKPFEPAALAEIVRRLLDADAHGLSE